MQTAPPAAAWRKLGLRARERLREGNVALLLLTVLLGKQCPILQLGKLKPSITRGTLVSDL